MKIGLPLISVSGHTGYKSSFPSAKELHAIIFSFCLDKSAKISQF